jgi:TPM domain
MQKIIILTILILNCWILPAQAIQLSPNWLTDMTGQITPETKKSVNELSQTFQRNHSLALYTLVTNGTENGLDAHRYIKQVFAENQLTDKDTLILLDLANRKVEMFSGMNSEVSDAIVMNAIARAKPLLVASDWNAATIALVTGVTSVVDVSTNFWLVIFVLIVLIVIIGALGGGSGGGSSSSYYSSSDSGSNGGGSAGDSF